MKKTFIILTAICISIGTTSFAQDKPSDDREKFQVGIKGGANYCGLFDEHAYDFNYDTKFAFMVGGYFTASISKYLGLQTEVLYSRRNIHAEGRLPWSNDVPSQPLNTNYSFKRQTSHIDIPLYVQFKQGDNLVFLAGPTISFLLSKKDEITYSNPDGSALGGSNLTKSQEVFAAQEYTTSTFGFGGGIDYRISRFVLGVRGYRDLSDTNNDTSIRAPYYKNKMFVLSLGFKLI